MRCWPPIRNTVGRPRCRCLPASCATPTSPRHRAPTSAESHRRARSEEHTSELQSPCNLVCRLLLEKENHTSELQARSDNVCRLPLERICVGACALGFFLFLSLLICFSGVHGHASLRAAVVALSLCL